jgi:hypothetical protein
MNNIGSPEENKGIIENISKSIEEYVESTKEGIVNNSVVNKGSEAITASSQIVSSAVNNMTMENAKEIMIDTVTNSSASIYFIIILLVLAAIVCYIIYYIIVDNIIYQKRILIPGTETPVLCSKHTKLPYTDVLDSGNGNKRTYCFWIYILDINALQGGNYRHFVTITDKKNKPSEVHRSSLCIRLNNKNNSLDFRFGTVNNNTPLEIGSANTFNTFIDDSGIKLMCGINIKYIPIQRWVHVAVVLNDNVGGSVTTYVDGNFVETLNNKNIKDLEGDPNIQINVGKLNLEHTGTLYVGGLETPVDSNIPLGFSGLLSRFTIFNFDLNRNDIYKEYSQGPIKGGLSALGLTAYGIRNPIYKLNSSDPIVYY